MSLLKNFFLITFLILSTFACNQNSTQLIENEIAQWRGPNRDGIYEESNLLNEWPENGPELLWKYEGIGKGYAAPVVLNDKVFVNGEKDSISYLFCFDTNGQIIWEKPNGEEFMGEGFSATYPGSRSTPTVVNDLVYATSGKSRVACFDADSGTEIWAVNLIDDLGGLDNFFGYSESVIVDDGKVYCFPGGKENNNVALDAFTGEIIWASTAMQDTFSYCSPILVELNNQKVIVTHSRHKLYLIECETGQALGSYHIGHYQYDGEHCNSPIFDNGKIYFIGNEKEDGAVKLTVSQEGKKLSKVWRNNKIKNNFNGYVKVGDNLFTTVKGNWLKAIDIETGLVADSVKAATGSIIYTDNKFYCYGMNGDFNMISYDQNQFENLSNFKITDGTGHHFAHPVIANGVLYIRHGNALMAYKI